MKYLHVARSGRDACMSLHNHVRNFTPDTLVLLDAISRNDPQFGDSYPRVPDDAGAFFHDWIADDGPMEIPPGRSSVSRIRSGQNGGDRICCSSTTTTSRWIARVR